jgi:ABC-type sugar transport system ATPase subunit
VNDVILELQGISKAFLGVHALHDVSVDVERGRVLGLVGQNGAGKSTLMNVIGGVVRPDSGAMRLDGEPYAPADPSAASASGIAFIHQELNLFSNLSIAENIFVDRFPRTGIGPFTTIDRRSMHARTLTLLERVGLGLAPETRVEDLSPGERQLVEIAKALELDARIIILDEPTTSLTARETERLFTLVDQLRQVGTTMIYISHILADVQRLADDIAILRDGALVASGARDAFSVDRMIALMVGRSLAQLFPPRTGAPTLEPLLEVRHLSATGVVRDVELTVHRGEVVGLFGLMGSGRTELARILFGLDAFDSGEIVVAGAHRTRTSPRRSTRDGVAFVTEDRRGEGMLMSVSIADNMALASLGRFAMTPVGFVDQARLLDAAAATAASLGLRSGAIGQQPASSLSGGNQQKVVIGRWLMSQPTTFILDEPTRGIDVAAKYDIYTIVDQLATGGGGVLFISSELEELMAMCDRILVMSRGEVVGEYARPDLDAETILRAAFREAVPA